MTLNKSVKPCDRKRLTNQYERVLKFMLRSTWKTLDQISQATGAPQASASARLRDCRRNGYRVESKRVKNGNGLHAYRVMK